MGDLFDYIVKSHPRLPERDARRVFQQIVAGVEHCHDRGVVHRDLKPENIFMDAKCNAKVGDFGLSANWRAGIVLTDSCGSPNYAAPELLQKQCQYEGPEVDIWALGCILYALLCSSLPFDAPDFKELFRLIKNGKYKVPGFLSTDARGLVGMMLVVDATKRAKISDIKKHTWFQTDLPAELAEAKKPSLPNLLVDNMSASKENKATSQTNASKQQARTPTKRCATALTLAPVTYTKSDGYGKEESRGDGFRRNSLSYSHTGYSVESSMYIFANQLAF